MGDKDHADHAATSAYSGTLASLYVLFGVNIYLSWLYPEDILAYIPLAVLYPLVTLKKHGLRSAVLSIGLCTVWAIWTMLLTLPIRLSFDLPMITPLSSTLPVLTLFSIIARPTKAVMPGGKLGWYWIRISWDPPLMVMVYVCWVFNVPFMDDGNGNFLTIMDENIVISSMPLNFHEDTLKAAKIRSVVNLQVEYGGPVAMYKRAGIQQLRLRTLDTTSPSLQQLQNGVDFIRSRKEAFPDSRVLIHCKGGRGRATTMALAWYICNGVSIDTGFNMIKTKRSVVEPIVKSYPALHTLASTHSS